MKKIIAFILALSLYLSKLPSTKIVKNLKIYKYCRGNVYIVKDALKNIVVKNNDVLIIDQTHKKDANMKIINSYKIIDLKEIDEIIDILLKYNKGNNNWNRTKESMKNEWNMHNILYYLNCYIERTKDVDLNNKDENKYRLHLN